MARPESVSTRSLNRDFLKIGTDGSGKLQKVFPGKHGEGAYDGAKMPQDIENKYFADNYGAVNGSFQVFNNSFVQNSWQSTSKRGKNSVR